MTPETNSPVSRVTVTPLSQDLSEKRFAVAVENCDVDDKKALVQYRNKWKQWMSWYSYSASEPHNIESQIHQMLFNDLTYRATVSVRESSASDAAISARSSTLAYLLDHGYVVSQVLALQKLLDDRKDVV